MELAICHMYTCACTTGKDWVIYSSESATCKELIKPHLWHHPSSGGYIDRWKHGWMDGQMYGQTENCQVIAITLCLHFAAKVTGEIVTRSLCCVREYILHML